MERCENNTLLTHYTMEKLFLVSYFYLIVIILALADTAK